jgi:hypothetical protein
VLRIALLSSLMAVPQPALEDRSRTQVPALQVFEGMLRQARAGEREKVSRSLDFLGPVLADHQRVFGPERVRDLVEAIRGSERAAQEAAVRTLVARDVIVLLRRLEGASVERSRTWSRTAAFEWRLLEPAALALDLRLAQSVAGGLRDVVEAVDSGDIHAAGRGVARIETDLVRLFSGADSR